jgi:hypothetical protein
MLELPAALVLLAALAAGVEVLAVEARPADLPRVPCPSTALDTEFWPPPHAGCPSGYNFGVRIVSCARRRASQSSGAALERVFWPRRGALVLALVLGKAGIKAQIFPELAAPRPR